MTTSSSFSHKNDKILVSLYYETLCPGCREFIVNQIGPTLKAPGLRDILDLHLVPYGNTKEERSSHGYNFTCQHGPTECEGNMYEACALYLNKNDGILAFPFIQCMESELQVNPIVSEIAAKCASLFHIDFKQLNKCATSAIGNLVMHKYATETGELDPPHKYVPWIVVNGEHTEEIEYSMMNNMLDYICKVYSGSSRPAGCPPVHN